MFFIKCSFVEAMKIMLRDLCYHAAGLISIILEKILRDWLIINKDCLLLAL